MWCAHDTPEDGIVGRGFSGVGLFRTEFVFMERKEFPSEEEQYRIIADDREFFLRFAACFGQYLIMADSTISYRHLPMRMFELTHYSFRREQRGDRPQPVHAQRAAAGHEVDHRVAPGQPSIATSTGRSTHPAPRSWTSGTRGWRTP